jgi:hypothetical protein
MLLQGWANYRANCALWRVFLEPGLCLPLGLAAATASTVRCVAFSSIQSLMMSTANASALMPACLSSRTRFCMPYCSRQSDHSAKAASVLSIGSSGDCLRCVAALIAGCNRIHRRVIRRMPSLGSQPASGCTNVVLRGIEHFLVHNLRKVIGRNSFGVS